MTRQVMNTLADRNIKGTVFTVGRIAESEPGLLREIADMGHEIACHSFDHLPLDKQSPAQLRENTKRAKKILEDCVGQEVVGFRAPVFSLVKHTQWFVDDLKEMGFSYSSSVMPARTPLYGFPGAPQKPFKWQNGLIELPCPVGRLGSLTLPYLGGFYLRYLPGAIIQKLLRQSSEASCLWTYCHPYDFDVDEPFARISGASLWVSLLLWLNRRSAMNRMLSVVGGGGGMTLASWVSEFQETLPTHASMTPPDGKEVV